jgi:hypothetical protein
VDAEDAECEDKDEEEEGAEADVDEVTVRREDGLASSERETSACADSETGEAFAKDEETDDGAQDDDGMDSESDKVDSGVDDEDEDDDNESGVAALGVEGACTRGDDVRAACAIHETRVRNRWLLMSMKGIMQPVHGRPGSSSQPSPGTLSRSERTRFLEL